MSLLPSSPETETNLLGAFVTYPREVGGKCSTVRITAEHFHLEHNALIFGVLEEMWREGEPIDTSLLTQKLRDRNQLERVGGPALVAGLFYPSLSNVDALIEILEDKRLLRRVLAICRQISERATVEQDDVQGIVAELQNSVLQLGESRKRTERKTFQQHIGELLNRLESGDVAKNIIPSGFRSIDKATGGFARGNLVVVAAETKVGKSAFAGNIAEHVAIGGGHVLFFSFEMSPEELVERAIQSQGRVCLLPMRLRKAMEGELQKIERAARTLLTAKIDIVDDAHGIGAMLGAARQIHAKSPVDLIILDYIQLVEHETRGRDVNREREVAAVTRSLKRLASELNCVVIALSQLNDQGKLRESRAIGQDANFILSIAATDQGGREVRITARSAGTGTVIPLRWSPQFTRFEDAGQ